MRQAMHCTEIRLKPQRGTCSAQRLSLEPLERRLLLACGVVSQSASSSITDGFDYPIGSCGYDLLNRPVPLLEFPSNSLPELNTLYPNGATPNPQRADKVRRGD